MALACKWAATCSATRRPPWPSNIATKEGLWYKRTARNGKRVCA